MTERQRPTCCRWSPVRSGSTFQESWKPERQDTGLERNIEIITDVMASFVPKTDPQRRCNVRSLPRARSLWDTSILGALSDHGRRITPRALHSQMSKPVSKRAMWDTVITEIHTDGAGTLITDG